ncbi:MAG TPA: SDR family oxidoreductase [Vicinamibacterales bacterium]|jgi:uncharacterized protein YbjT (DUF2867 family)
MSNQILVLGASGRVGGFLARELRRRGERPVAAVRHPERLPHGAALETIRFDFDDEATFRPALEGIERVFLIARPGDEHADRTALPFIDEMRRAGVRAVVNLTAMGVDRLPGNALNTVERSLEASGMAFTHLRPNFFMQIFAAEPLLGGLRQTGLLQIPAGDATLSFIDARDIADVAAEALLNPVHEGQAYTLTGGEALDHGQVAAAISSATGRPCRYVAIDEEAARAAMAAGGFPPDRVERLIGFYRLVRSGACSPVSNAVEQILGRPPRGFDQFARDNGHIWKDEG